MNRAHLKFCSSPEWARLVEDELLPWVLDGRELGDDLLEVDPGTLEGRLRAAGFGWAQVDVADDRLRFAALRLAGAVRPAGR